MASNSPRQFSINRSPFSSHYLVLSPTGNPLFYIDESTFTLNKPDLTVHEGHDKNGPIIAVSHIPKISFNFKIALGDPLSTANNSVQWEELTKEKNSLSEYLWSMDLVAFDPKHNHAEKQLRQRRDFVWKRTHSVAVDGGSPAALSNRNFKLLDCGNKELLAVFNSEWSLKKCGVLQINVDYGRDFDIMVLITCLSLYERARRRSHKTNGGGGGG